MLCPEGCSVAEARREGGRPGSGVAEEAEGHRRGWEPLFLDPNSLHLSLWVLDKPLHSLGLSFLFRTRRWRLSTWSVLPGVIMNWGAPQCLQVPLLPGQSGCWRRHSPQLPRQCVLILRAEVPCVPSALVSCGYVARGGPVAGPDGAVYCPLPPFLEGNADKTLQLLCLQKGEASIGALSQ